MTNQFQKGGAHARDIHGFILHPFRQDLYGGRLLQRPSANSARSRRCTAAAEQIPDGPVIDARDARVIPGIIDTHNHGTCGWSLEHPRGFAQDVETVCRYVKACASQGITGVFPTAVPAMISACAQAAALHPVGAEICGIHSEGPWLARSGEGGSMPPCAPADMNTAYSLWEDARGLLRLVSLAPGELPACGR